MTDTTRDPEKLAEKILADPNTKKIADSLGVTLEEYAQTVLRFMLNPGDKPEFVGMREEDLKKLGYAPPDPEAMRRYIDEAMKMRDLQTNSAFEDPKEKKVDLGRK